MISIRKAASDLDRLQEIITAMTFAYEQALHSTAQYAVEFDAADTALFRKHLETMGARATAASVPADWNEIEASFRGELREYRDRAAVVLGRMRMDLEAAAAAMQIFANSVTANAEDHETHIKQSVGQLNSLAQTHPQSELTRSIRAAAGAIEQSLGEMQSSHKLAVALFQDEIRLLHQQIDHERRALEIDRETGVWNRQKLDAHIAALLENDRSFCVLLVCVRNYKRLDQRYSSNLIAGALKALLQRFAATFPDGAAIGRWAEDNFAAILEEPTSQSAAASREIAARLSGPYSVQENGLSQTVLLQAATGVVDRPVGCSAALLQQRLLQMFQTLSAG